MIITILIWILGFVVLGTLCVATFIIANSWLFENTDATDLSIKWSLFPTIAISAGVLIAILAFARERQKLEIEQQRHKSKVLVERVTLAFDTVISLLRNKTNSRVIWIRAARTLRSAIELGEQIKDPDYRQAFVLETTRARNELYDALTVESAETGQRRPLPPQFFYGVDDWENSTKTLNETAIEASHEISAYKVTIDQLPFYSDIKPLSVRSVVAIYEFLEYPADYKDPLDQIPEWDDNWDRAHGVDEGARRYVTHRRNTTVVNGEVHEPKTPK